MDNLIKCYMGNNGRGTEMYMGGGPRYYGDKIVLGRKGKSFLLAERDILLLGDFPDKEWLVRGVSFKFEPDVYLELGERCSRASKAGKGPLYWVCINAASERKEIVTYKYNYCDMIGTDDIWDFAQEYKKEVKDKTMEQVVNDLWDSVQGLKYDLRKYKADQKRKFESFDRLYASDKEYLIDKVNQNDKFNDNNFKQVWKRLSELELKSGGSVVESYISSVKKQEKSEEADTRLQLRSDFRKWIKDWPDDRKYIPHGVNEFVDMLSKKYTLKK